ncbi:MAG TPA: hypothetical protein PL187_17625 [Caldilinea sp.]|nr:hypothetical protein [Caldilinea sp.]
MRQPAAALGVGAILGRVDEQVEVAVGVEQVVEGHGLVRVGSAQLGQRALLRRAQRGGVKGEQVERQPGLDRGGLGRAQRRQLLIEEVAQQQPLAAQAVIEGAVKGRMVVVALFGLIPQLAEQNLQRGRHRGTRVRQQVVGDLADQPFRHGQAEVTLHVRAVRRPRHRLDDAAAVEPLQKDLGVRQLACGQQLLDLGQPLLAKAEDQPALRSRRWVAKARGERIQEVGHLARHLWVGARVDLLHLVEDHGERLAHFGFDAAPGCQQIGAAKGSVDLQRLA